MTDLQTETDPETSTGAALSRDDPHYESKLTVRLLSVLSELLFVGASEEMLGDDWGMHRFIDDVPESLDQARALHYEVFFRQMLPVMGLFVSQTKYIDPTIRELIIRLYRSCDLGWVTGRDDSDGDHIGILFKAVAVLMDDQVVALEQGDEPEARKLAQRHQRLLREYVMPWLPPLYLAIQEVSPGFYAQWLNVILLRLEDERLIPSPGLQRAYVKPFDPMSDPETGLRQIREWLLIPARSGIYITPQTLQQIGQALDLPSGFGGRDQILDSLLRAAGEYDKVGELLAVLADYFDSYADEYERIKFHFPAMTPYITPWQDAAQKTLHSLDKMAEVYDQNIDS